MTGSNFDLLVWAGIAEWEKYLSNLYLSVHLNLVVLKCAKINSGGFLPNVFPCFLYPDGQIKAIVLRHAFFFASVKKKILHLQVTERKSEGKRFYYFLVSFSLNLLCSILWPQRKSHLLFLWVFISYFINTWLQLLQVHWKTPFLGNSVFRIPTLSLLSEFIDITMSHVACTLWIPKFASVNSGRILSLIPAKAHAIDSGRAAYSGRCVARVTTSIVGVFHEFHAKFYCDKAQN